MTSYLKDPQAVLDYRIDWTAWLSTSETISAATVTVPAGLTKDSQSFTNTAVTVWLSGGTVGESYMIVCHVLTNQGREDDRTIRITIRDR